MAIDGSEELIQRGYHREAMFWIAVTHSRCQKVLPRRFSESYLDLPGDLGIASSAEVRRRCAEIERPPANLPFRDATVRERLPRGGPA